MQGFAKLETSSKVAVIGGGPAGSFFALCLLHFARQKGIQPEITIYQQRNFDEPGPKGCKGCAGVLSQSLLSNLDELGLTIPEEIIQSRIERYAVHSPYTSISISSPEKGMPIVSIYRGGGPLISHYENSISFDGWLLEQAKKQGITVKNERVSRVYLEPETQIRVGNEKLACELVVLASGVNVRAVPIQGLDYIAPQTQIMAQDELYAGADVVASRLGNMAHVFLIPHSGLVFGSLVPKGPFINVSLLSTGKHPISVSDFLSHDLVRSVLPERYQRACGCRPRASISSAKNYYTDRFVAIGEAAVSRLYKDGIGSSLLTAREAARTVVNHGTSRQALARYYQPLCQSIHRDNRWGRLLFSLNDRAKDSRVFLLAEERLIGNEQDNEAGRQPLTRAVWGMFTGSYRYRNIARTVLSPASLARLGWSSFQETLTGLSRRERLYPKKLYVGSRKVLILGSGFGGTYSLRHLVRSLNKNENVLTTMVSDENFFLFSPLLHEVAMGSIETRHIAYPIRRLHWRDRFTFVQAEVEKIDLAGRQVVTNTGTLGFDYLILALGSVTDMSDLPSAGENVFKLKTLHDAMLIRNHIIGVFEQASIQSDRERQQQLLTFVVSGGGYVGIQLVTQMRDLVRRNLGRFYKTIDPDNIRVILLEAESKIVAGLHTKLGAYAMKHLQRTGIEVRLRSRVTGVWEDRLEINGTEIVPTNTLIWVAGVIANPRIAELDVEKDRLGRVLVNKYLEVPGFPGVYAVGDCASFEDPRSGQPIPPRAHNAARQAKIAAENILADIRGRDKRPYRYAEGGEIVTLGNTKAVFRFRGLRLYGLPARLLWLAAYSLLVTGHYNRLRILMDWLFSLVFGRDTTFLKLKR